MIQRPGIREVSFAAALLVLAFGGGAAIAVLGASGRHVFAWPLFGEGATAFGTVLLAAYTASLARSTRREVAVTLEEQRARERPVVVAVVEDLGAAPLEPHWAESVPVVNVRLLNVGLGPALNLHLQVRYPEADGEGREVVSVLPVDDPQIRSIAIPTIHAPREGFAAERFILSGSFEGRTPGVRDEITLLADEGLRDLQRAAQRRAAVRGNPYFSIGSRLVGSDEKAEYQGQVGNTAPGTAYEVEIVFIDADEREWARLTFAKIDPRHTESATIALPVSHPLLSYKISWRDGEGEQERVQTDVLQPLPNY